MIKLIENGTISSKIAKTVFKELVENGGDPETIVKEKGLVQISDEGALLKVVEEAINNNPQSVEDFKAGKQKAVGFLVGQIMKATKGQANPQMVNKLLVEELNKRIIKASHHFLKVMRFLFIRLCQTILLDFGSFVVERVLTRLSAML